VIVGVLRSFLLILALIGAAGCIHRPHTSTGSGAERDQVALVPSPEEVVGAVGFTGITEPEFVAWTKANSDSPGTFCLAGSSRQADDHSIREQPNHFHEN
jgi:hypothetical protein